MLDEVTNIVLLPFRLIWNIIVTGLIIGGFILWFGFIFGSVIGIILILIFAPELFLLPLVLAIMYTPIWPPISSPIKNIQNTKEDVIVTINEQNNEDDTLKIFTYIGGVFLFLFVLSWSWKVVQ